MAKRGGKREGSGRRPSAVEENVKVVIKMALDQSGGEEAMIDVWKMIIDKAKKGSDKHAQILLNYMYGKPVDNINVKSGMVVHFTREVVE